MADTSTKRIFVSIPSYRDTECQHTIADIFSKAARPDNVFVGVCFQLDEANDAECFAQWPHHREAQIRLDKVDYKLATGPCWARFRAQQLWQGEEFYLSIDSHTRFIKNWDTTLLTLLEKCDSPKPIITTYPVGYELPNKLSLDPRPTFTTASKIAEDGMLRLAGKLLARPSTTPLRSFFWVSGFSFSSSQMLKEVPYDPHLPHIFFGEESSMTVRLWTHGWDFFAPGKNIIFHLWSRDHRPTFRENRDPENLERFSRQRVHLQLGIISKDQIENQEAVLINFDKYTLGSARSLDEYQIASGVDFKAAKVEDLALFGGLPKTEFADYLLDVVLAAMK